MKKLLYIVPLALIGLSLTPFALYKDTVKYGSSLDTLSPSHWQVIDMQMSFSGSLNTSEELNPTKPLPEPEPVSKDAAFKGFPFGAYFSRSESSANSSLSVSGYSWLWAGVDILLIAVSLVAAFKANRNGKEAVVGSESEMSQPPVYNADTMAAPPSANNTQPEGGIPPTQTPSQPAQPPTQPTSQPGTDTPPYPPQS